MKPIGTGLLVLVLLVVGCSPLGRPTSAGSSLSESTASPSGGQLPAVSATPGLTAVPAGAQQLASVFAYDASRPLDVRVESQNQQDGAIIQDITFASVDPDFSAPSQGRNVAYLVMPAASGHYAAVLFLHQLEGLQDKKEFLAEAVQLAQTGVVSILPNGLLPWKVKFTGSADQDQQDVIHQVVEFRRALDVLLSQPGVDPARVACVGHDYGAMYAGLLAAVDHRVKACVLMAGDSTFSNWPLEYHMMPAPADVDAYKQALATVDPIQVLAGASPTALLFQFGQHDNYIPEATAQALYDAASAPKTVQWYPAGHDLDQTARADRLSWLAKELALTPGP